MSKGFNFKTKPIITVSKAPINPTALAPVVTNITATQSVFDALPDSAWLRESQLVRSPKNPESAVAPLPFSAPTLWRMVNAGKFPAPCKLSTRVTAWKVSQVREWMTAQAAV
jgi:predicted DNA-binding transcriptional regulator AlpA